MEWIKERAIMLTVIATVFLIMYVGGYALQGVAVGLIGTIAIWILVSKLPGRVKRLLGKYPFASDLVISAMAAGIFSKMGSGLIVAIACVTQMCVLSLLLQTLSTEKRDA